MVGRDPARLESFTWAKIQRVSVLQEQKKGLYQIFIFIFFIPFLLFTAILFLFRARAKIHYKWGLWGIFKTSNNQTVSQPG